MELPINKDPQDLNKSVFSGRKYWQWICIFLAGAIAVTFTLIFSKYIGSTLNGIIIAVLVVPLGYIGVFQKNGLDFFEYYKQKRLNKTNHNVFLYVSDIPKQKDLFLEEIPKKGLKTNVLKGKSKKNEVKVVPTISEDTIIDTEEEIGGNKNG